MCLFLSSCDRSQDSANASSLLYNSCCFTQQFSIDGSKAA
jgi:hypothetical protein